jgi:hypothetical protein
MAAMHVLRQYWTLRVTARKQEVCSGSMVLALAFI